MKHLVLFYLGALLLAGCGAPSTPPSGAEPGVEAITTAQASPEAESPTLAAREPSGTPHANTDAGAATATPPAGTATPSTDELLQTAELLAFLRATLPTPTLTSEGDTPDFDLAAQKLPGAQGQQLWMVYSVGGYSYAPLSPAFLALYAPAEGGWRELSRVTLPGVTGIARPRTSDATVSVVEFEPKHTWIQVRGNGRSHDQCYALLHIDGSMLSNDITFCRHGDGHAAEAGWRQDIDGDGQLDLYLGAEGQDDDSFPFKPGGIGGMVLRWNGQALEQVELAPLPETAPDALRQLNDEAIRLAQAGLWMEANLTIRKARELDPAEPIVRWNAALILLPEHSLDGLPVGEWEAWASSCERACLSSYIRVGDYDGALAIARRYPAERLFEQPPGDSSWDSQEPRRQMLYQLYHWDKIFDERIAAHDAVQAATQAIEVQPELASAYFVRALAGHTLRQMPPVLEGGQDWPVVIELAQVLADLRRAAELDTREPLYAESLAALSP